ncbi:hypothetical protein FBU30_002971, partial [Linnemannia zychae]
HVTSAEHIHEVSHTRKLTQQREKRLAKNPAVKHAYDTIQAPENSISTADTLEKLKAAHNARSSNRSTLRKFENLGSQLRDQHTRRFRRTRTWQKAAAAERRFRRTRTWQKAAAAERRFRRTRTWQKAAAAERRFVTDHGGAVSPVDGYCSNCGKHHFHNAQYGKTFAHTAGCHKLEPLVIPIMIEGAAGTAVGSRIKGHIKRGGGKMVREHRQDV